MAVGCDISEGAAIPDAIDVDVPLGPLIPALAAVDPGACDA
jgi:hypothetical protein